MWYGQSAPGLPSFTPHRPPALSHTGTPGHQLPHDLTPCGVACNNLEVPSASRYKSTSAVGCDATLSLLQTLWTDNTTEETLMMS